MLDCVDLGCGVGGSIGWAKSRFGGETFLGIDNRKSELERAREKGYNVVFADITDVSCEIPKCRFITMLHFLEHLKNEAQVKNVLEKSVKAATEFIFIKVPCFDKIKYLASLGFKLTWTDWIGHPTNVTTEMLKKITEELKFEAKIGSLYKINDSSSNEIVPICSPVDTIVYSEKLGAKELIQFKDVYRETYCLINVNCQNFQELSRYEYQ
ncbi:MAG: class I SAM-dependent methyltransferase [Candidatus Nanoarchaeia archaeon]|jgi:hypothetical protein|nr:class I SAM-dependent methyltransferase [Candidatus Nanoarchaeia archaeon]